MLRFYMYSPMSFYVSTGESTPYIEFINFNYFILPVWVFYLDVYLPTSGTCRGQKRAFIGSPETRVIGGWFWKLYRCPLENNWCSYLVNHFPSLRSLCFVWLRISVDIIFIFWWLLFSLIYVCTCLHTYIHAHMYMQAHTCAHTYTWKNISGNTP